MVEKRVSVRLAAVGGEKVKAELASLGREGKAALRVIAEGAGPASAGLGQVGASAGEALGQMEALAARATRAAAALRAAGATTGTLAERIDVATGIAGRGGRSAADIAAYGTALDDLRARHNPLFAVIREYKGTLADIRQAHAVGAISADEMTAAISRERQAALGSIAAIKGRAGALEAMAASSRMAAFQSRILLFQLNDVFVSLASGMNPLMVAIQQGSQISQIYGPGEGGIGRAFAETGRMIGGVVARFPILTALVAAAGVAVAGMMIEMNRASDVTVGLGDVALATWQVIADGLVTILKPVVDAIAPWFTAAWDLVVTGVKVTGNAIINTFRAAFETVRLLWDRLDDIVGNAAIQSANALVAGIETGVNKSVELLNALAARVSSVLAQIPGVGEDFRIPDIPPVAIERIENPYAEAAGAAVSELQGRLAEIFASDPLGSFFEAIRARAVANARAGGEEAPLGRTAGAADRTGEALRRAAELARPAWEGVTETIDKTAETLRGIAGDITGPLKEALMSGELSWKTFASAVAGIAKNLADRIVTQAFKPIEEAIANTLGKALAGGGAGGGSGIFGKVLGFLGSAVGGLFGLGGGPGLMVGPGTGGLYARGGAFDRAGEVTAFARGGIVDRPTVFPFARGVGLMGEAGPEAILPLRRGRGGRLGVEVAGPEKPPTPPATRIINVLDPAIVGDYLATPSGERAIVNVIRRNRSALDG